MHNITVIKSDKEVHCSVAGCEKKGISGVQDVFYISGINGVAFYYYCKKHWDKAFNLGMLHSPGFIASLNKESKV